jgi:hypothetical protein
MASTFDTLSALVVLMAERKPRFEFPADVLMALAAAAVIAWGWSPFTRWLMHRLAQVEVRPKVSWVFTFGIYATWFVLACCVDWVPGTRDITWVRFACLMVAVVVPPFFLRRLVVRPRGTVLPYAYAIRVAITAAVVPFVIIGIGGLGLLLLHGR